MRILFLCKKSNKKFSHYNSSGLLNSATFVSNALNKNGHESKVEVVFDGNCVDRAVHQYKPQLVILEAIWVTPAKLQQLVGLHPKVKWVVRIHSKAPFLANEGIAFEWINEYIKIKNVRVAVNNIDFYNDLIRVGYRNTAYLPNIYEVLPPNPKPKKNPSIIDIGCMGAIRPMKNHLQQAICAIIFADCIGKKLRFHINSTRFEQNGEAVLKNLRNLFSYVKHELVEHEWLSHKDFTKLVSTFDIGMQVSFSESFNIICADYVSQKVPVVASKEVKFIYSMFTAEPTSTSQILNGLYIAYYYNYFHYHSINEYYLSKSNAYALNEWLSYLRK